MQIIKAKLDKSSGISRIKLENILNGKTEFIPYFNSAKIYNQVCNYLLNKGMQVNQASPDKQGNLVLIISSIESMTAQVKVQKMYHVYYSLGHTAVEDRKSGFTISIPYDTEIDCVLTQAIQHFREKGVRVNSHSYDNISKIYVLFTDV